MSAPTHDAVPHAASPAGEIRCLVTSELRKALSTSTWWALLVPAALLALVYALLTAKHGEYLAMSQMQALDIASLFVPLFGAVCAAGEYRHNTIVTSYLNAARRSELAVAKMIFAALVGVLYGLVSAVAGVGGLLLSGTSFEGELPWVLAVSAGGLAVFALWAVLGVGVGMLLRRQSFAVLAVLLYSMLVEPILVYVGTLSESFDHVTDYLPGEAARYALKGLTGGEQFGGGFGVAQAWWPMLAVLAGYAAVAMLAGNAAARRRDLT